MFYSAIYLVNDKEKIMLKLGCMVAIMLSGDIFKTNICPLVSGGMPSPDTTKILYHLFQFYLQFESLLYLFFS